MGISLGDNIKVTAGLPVDCRYQNGFSGPYTDTGQTVSTITSGFRYTGLTVNIAGTEYWWKEGIADGDLVEKTTGGGGTPPNTISSGTTNTSDTGHTHCYDASTFVTGEQGICVDGSNRFYLNDSYIENTVLPNLYEYSAITANQSIGVLPSGQTLGMVYITNTGGTTGFYNLGTTETGNDITPFQPIEVAPDEDVSVTVNLRLSNTENKTMWVNSADWTDAGINLQWAHITYKNANITIYCTGSTGGGVGTLQQVTDSGCTTTNSIIIGSNSEATGTTSFVIGSFACAWGNSSFAHGTAAKALGHTSYAQASSRACGDCSHAEGRGTCAIGVYTHSEGWCTKACGQNSHAEGYFTHACGADSHAEGGFTCTMDLYAHAEGECTVASGRSSHASGRFNVGIATTIAEIGVGSSAANRCNAFEVYCNGQVALPQLTGKTSETCVIYIDAEGKLTSGVGGGGGGVAVSGTVDTAITTYINASGDLCAQSNLKFNGSTMYLNGNMSFCNGSDRTISVLNTTSAPSRTLILKSQEYHGFETSGDVKGGGICACGGFGNNTSESGGSGTGGPICLCAGTGKIHTGSATGGLVEICGGRGWVTTSGASVGGAVQICGGDGDTTGRILLGGLPSKVSETCVVWIDASGNLSTATPASDCRLKCCVTPISSASSMLSGICGYSAEFNSLSNCEGCCEYVFLAQEVEKELPLAVKNGVIINDIDYKKVEYDQLVPVMWNIIKEQEARIQAIEAQLNNR